MNNQNNGILNNISIKNKITLLVLFIALTMFITCTVINYHQITATGLTTRQTEVSAITEVALNLIKEYKQRADTGELTVQEAQKKAIARISHLNFDKNNYIWINNYNNIFLVHPTKKGKNGTNMTDKNGFKVLVEATKIAREKGSGSFKYYWSKPGADQYSTFEKISYIRNFPEWGWVIGAGIYTLDATVQTTKDIRNSLIFNSIINLIIVFIAVIIANLTIGKSITEPILKFTEISQKLAKNDLTVQIPEDNNQTEIGNLNRTFKKFLYNLKTLIGQISELSVDVTTSSEEMSAAADQTAVGAQQVATSVSHLAAGSQEQSNSVTESLNNINSINRKVQRISEGTENTVSLSKTAETHANQGLDQAQTAVNKINQIKINSIETSNTIAELGKLGSDIEIIVDLIKNIANQTNLLALNAAIEAARAGEHGKGFAVVADEVKKLAGQSADATEQITAMIKQIQNKATAAVNIMDEGTQEVDEGVIIIENVGNSLQEIIQAIKETSSQIEFINGEISRLANNSDEVAKMMENISAITEESTASSEEIASITEEQTASLEEVSASSQTLAQIAKNLQKQVSVFKL
ncbi:MAG: methyl-accepting chemotaxis protein [Candidatus Gastranaerophilaceae bacterium]|jgi:methyl-accepting chemotaxis protein